MIAFTPAARHPRMASRFANPGRVAGGLSPLGRAS
jgi:hypothetical protein